MIPVERNAIRKDKIMARNQLPIEIREAFSSQIVSQILASEAYEKAHTIMLYRAIKGEASLKELETKARKQGKRLVFPLCINKKEMIALEPLHEMAWKQGLYGIEEPILEASKQVLPEEIDLILCPCTVFDETGNRMGMGAGFYDRFLPACQNASIAAVAFEVQKADHVPAAQWDYKMHIVFTEKMTYHIS